MRRTKRRITKCITFSPDLLAMMDEIGEALCLSRATIVDMAVMHWIDYLGTGRTRHSTPALYAKRLRDRGLDIKLKKRRNRVKREWIRGEKQDTNQDKSSQIQDTNTLTCESTVIDSIDPDFQANNKGSNPGDCQPDTGPMDASLRIDALSQADGEANQA